ncbi:MAG: hypothetical protein RBG1_1C00001G0165 [candidate division Zixibacteria bacterium RBG-1]|nr:MAG: hypothetical protein RBG1_1C00001G0165 [candidate division Zixibacteria bacterium RBG-1]
MIIFSWQKWGDVRKLSVVLVVVLICLVNCTKNPSGPTSPESSLVYLPHLDKVFVVDSSQDKILDSMKFNFYISDLNLSPDRRVLYLQKVEYRHPCRPPCPDSIVEVNVNNKTIIYEGENSSLFPTPEGRLLVSTYNGLKIFSARTHQIVYEDNLVVTTRPTFDSQYPLFYVGMADKRILVFDYQRLQIVRYLDALVDKKFPPIFDILYSEIDNKLYFSSYFSPSLNDSFITFTSYLGNIDIKRDRIITMEQLNSSWGEGYLYSSTVTKKIYDLCWCFCVAIPELIPFSLFGFSTNTQEIVSELDLYNASLAPFSLKVLEGSQKAYLVDSWSGNIAIIDLEQNKIVGYISR